MSLQMISISAQSVATVGACAAVGAYAHWIGVLSNTEVLEKLVQSVFLPSLILVKVVPNMNPATLFDIWPLAVMCICTMLYGLAVGAIVTRSIPKYRGLVMVAVAFPNSFSVPLTLLLALGDRPVLLADGQAGGKALAARVNTLFLMSYSVWVLARWGIGYPILTGALSLSQLRKKVLNPPVVACLLAVVVGLAWNMVPEDNQTFLSEICTCLNTALSYAGRCCVPSTLMLLGAQLSKAILEMWSTAKPGSVDLEDPLLATSGEQKKNLDRPRGDTATHDCMPAWAYVVVLVLRQVLGPLFGVAIGCGLMRGLCGVTEPVVLMVGMLQSAGPPMINLGVMAGLSGCVQQETAKVLLLTYGFSVVSWTASIALFLGVL